jgi:very-short-patch-repair endonuclease
MKLSSIPHLVKEWHPTKNGELTPNDITHGSHTKVWWLCANGHSYEQLIKNKTILKYGCPECSGRRASETNNLSTQYPEIGKEWHPTLNKDFKATEVTYGSEKQVWWLCPKGHSYNAIINNRTLRQSGCPQCSNQSSEPEIRILTEFKYLFDNVVSRYKVDGIEIDVCLPDLNLGIEYDGKHWHKEKEEQDLEKNKRLATQNIHLIRVREKPLKALSDEDVIVDKDNPLKKNDLNKIVKKVSAFVNADISQRIDSYIAKTSFVNDDLFKEYRSYFPSPFPEHSLLKTHPELSNEWDYEKNSPLKPENFSYGVKNKMWWLCQSGHSFQATINHRTGNKPTGCPQCSGRIASNDNNLLKVFPQVAKEWHPEKNGELTPEKVTPKSGKKVWWTCPKDHSYEATVHNRTGNSSDCPYCAGHKSLNLDLFSNVPPNGV